MSCLIREFNEHDDFELIIRLHINTLQRLNPDPNFMGINETADDIKKALFPNNPDESNVVRKGFVAEQNGMIIAFMEVIVSKITKNGTISFGWEENCEYSLNNLIEKCSQTVRENGGSKLMVFLFNKVGQVRNKSITFWERMGFESDEYSFMAAGLNLRDWVEPGEDFENSNIEPAVDLELEQVKQILIDDGEEEMAELFERQFFPQKEPDQVLLTFRDKEANQIAGIAYYRVYDVNDNDFYHASGFWIHFRPAFHLENKEKIRFLQAALMSMKQINVFIVTSRLTTKNFDVFSMMIREGFEAYMENNSTIRLVKKV